MVSVRVPGHGSILFFGVKRMRIKSIVGLRDKLASCPGIAATLLDRAQLLLPDAVPVTHFRREDFVKK
jgi:hypothetical protein